MLNLRRNLQRALLVLSILLGMTSPGQAQGAKSLTLTEAVASALQHHPQLGLANAAREQAQAALREARSAELPTLSGSEDILYSNDPVFAFGSKLRQARFSSADLAIDSLNHPDALSNFSASATANWTAFDGGIALHKVAGARAALGAAELSTRFAGDQVAARVTTLYFRALLAHDQIAVAEAAAARAQEVSSDIGDRVRAGLSLESDGARADLLLQTSNDDLATANDNAALARQDLFNAIGETDSGQLLVQPEAQIVQPSETDLRNRLDIQSLRLQEQAAKQDISAIRATAWPRVTTFGHVENDAEYFATNGSGNWMLGAQVQLNVFDGGARRAKVQQATAHLHALEEQERSTLLDARSNTSALASRIKDLRRRLVATEAAARVQQEVLSTSRDRYSNGLVSISDLLTAESDLSAADFQHVSTFYQLCIARAELALADGSMTTQKAGQP